MITWRRGCSLITSLRRIIVNRLVLLRLRHIGLLTRLHRCIPLFTPMYTVRSWSRNRRWWSIMTLVNDWRGAITVEPSRLGVVLIM